MTRPAHSVLSPLLVFTALLAAFEFCVRLPFVLWVQAHPETGALMHMNFFATFPPASVLTTGLALTTLATLATAAGAMVAGPVVAGESRQIGLARVPATLWLVAPLVLGAAILSVTLLGRDALIEDISGKRSDVGQSGGLWLLLRLAMFAHVIACLFYIRLTQSRALLDKLGFIAALLAVIIPAIVFSQRAGLVTLLLEIMYLQLLLGTFRPVRALRVALALLPVIFLISVLRPAAATLSLGEALALGAEKLVVSRYFLDFTKLGAVTLWAAQADWLGPVALTFMAEPFLGEGVVFYKELGPLIGAEVYLLREEGGVTPGIVLELILSFGTAGGVIAFGAITWAFLLVERRLLVNAAPGIVRPLVLLLAVGKFPLLLNSSLGAFAFQLVVEGTMLAVTLSLVHGLARLGRGPGRGPGRGHPHRPPAGGRQAGLARRLAA